MSKINIQIKAEDRNQYNRLEKKVWLLNSKYDLFGEGSALAEEPAGADLRKTIITPEKHSKIYEIIYKEKCPEKEDKDFLVLKMMPDSVILSIGADMYAINYQPND
jgi:hypothetical protein